MEENAPKKILIYVVSYNAEQHIASVFSRIPAEFINQDHVTIYVSDDASKDQTTEVASNYIKEHNIAALIKKNAQNLGYGGNQKLGYQYAIEQGFDVVVLLHGDGQYAPEYLGAMVEPIVQEKADVVLGSRMVSKGDALKGGMPLYKWFGNIFLTTVQNVLLGTKLHEFHTGYRAYNVHALKEIALQKNSDDFVFDTEIIIQLIDKKKIFAEVKIPTFYGDEISHVDCVKYGFQVLGRTIAYRLHKLGITRSAKYK